MSYYKRGRATTTAPYRRGAGGPTQTARRVRRRTTTRPVRTVRGRYAGYERTGGYYGKYNKPGLEELKFHDVDVDDAAIAQNGTILNSGSVNLIAQGTSESERIGRKCTVRSIAWRGNIHATTAASTGASETVKVILYVDKQANGATAAVTDILESDNYQSFNNLSNSSRFRILHTQTFVLQPTAGMGDGTTNDVAPNSVNFEFYKKCEIPLEFSSTTGAITEIRSDNIGVMITSKQGNVAVLDSKMRLRFSDQ